MRFFSLPARGRSDKRKLELVRRLDGCVTRGDDMTRATLNRDEGRPTEDDIQRERLGPRGVPGEPDPAKMTPTRDKKTPKSGDFDGHTA